MVHGELKPPSSRRAKRRSSSAAARRRATELRPRRGAAEGLPQQRQGGPPGLAHRGVAAGQAEAAQVGHPLERRGAAEQHLAAPHGAVRPVAGAVPGEAEDRPVAIPRLVIAHPVPGIASPQTVLRQAGGEVGVVVLHGEARQPGESGEALRGVAVHRRRRPAGGRVVGMEVVDQGRRPRLPEVEEVGHRRLEGGLRARVLHVAEVLRDEHLVAEAQGDGVLELGADREQRRRLASARRKRRQAQRQRRVAAGAAQQPRRAGDPAHHAVVGVAGDRPVVDQEAVGDAAQPFDRLVLGGDDGLLGEVAAGRHHRPAELRHQQVVERRVGEHQAELRLPRGHLVGDRRTRQARQQHDGCLGRRQQVGGRFIHRAQRAGGVEVGHHQRQRLGGALLAPPQLGHRRGVRRHRPPGGSRPAP